MSKIVVGVAEVNAKNNPNLAELAAVDLERKISERFEEGAEVKSVSCFQNDRAFQVIAVVDGDEKEPVEEEDIEEDVEEDDEESSKRSKKKGGKK